MNNLQQIEFYSKNICSSAYKILLFLKILICSPSKTEEIIDIFNNDNLVDVNITKESINIFKRVLQKIGCKIHKPIVLNNKPYFIENCPFLINLSNDEISLINKFRKNPYEKNDWKSILYTNSFINKLCLVVNNKRVIEKLKNNNSLSSINTQMILELNECCKKRSYLIFKYKSGIRICNIELIASFLKYERNKLYLWGFSPVFDDFIYLRMDKILSYKVYEEFSPNIQNGSVVRYIMYNKNYILEEKESLVEETPEGFIIDYKISNDFHATQKFLELGCDCKILSPESFKKNFIETLKNIKTEYCNE